MESLEKLHTEGAPDTAWPIVGHAWAVRFLRQITSPINPAIPDSRDESPAGGLRHAYLFLGPAHIGKSTLARLFAGAILCTHPTTRPCGACRACGLMARETHPDLRLVQPTDKDGKIDRINGTLRADAANEIVHEAALRPVEASHKIFLIQDAHTANSAFANKLLKTLEEPPAYVVLCLTALDRQQLLPTIVSRCQAIELRPTPRAQIQTALTQRWDAEPEQAELLARLANGRMGWAVQQLQSTGQEARLEQLQILWQLAEAGSVDRLNWAEKLSLQRDSRQLFGMLELWVNWWRDVLLFQAGCGDACSNIDQQARIQAYAEATDRTDVLAYLDTLQRVERYLHHTVNTRLALDVLMLRLPQVKAVG